MKKPIKEFREEVRIRLSKGEVNHAYYDAVVSLSNLIPEALEALSDGDLRLVNAFVLARKTPEQQKELLPQAIEMPPKRFVPSFM